MKFEQHFRNYYLRLLVLICLLIPASALAQDLKVNGVVVDSQKRPLLGVTIYLESRNTGTSTGIDGEFSIDAARGDKLTVSYIGYESQTIVVNSAKLDVTLEEDNAKIEEVVVIGYGAVKRSDLTGAVSSVSSDQLTRTGQSTVEQALIGQAPGVIIESGDNAPGAVSSIRIRGSNSINASSEPLYVIDGIPIMNSSSSGDSGGATALSPIAGLSPEDIESIDVLKDASATAIYGAQGANGVIIITTKKGGGRFNVNVNISGGIQVADEDKYDIMNSEEFANFKHNYSFTYPDKCLMTEEDIANNTYHDFWDTSKFVGYPTTDWMDEVIRDGSVKNVHVGISGGNNGTSYNVGVGYYNNKGILINTNMDRYSLNMNLQTDPEKRIQIGINSMMSYIINDGMLTSNAGTANQTAGILLQALRYNPMIPLKDADGNYTVEDPEGENSAYSPYLTAQNVQMQSRYLNLNVNAFMNVKLYDDLSFKLSLGSNVANTDTRNFYPNTTSWGKDANGKSMNRNGTSTKWVSDAIFNYNKKWENHSLNAIVGGSMTGYDDYYVTINSENFPIQDLGSNGIQVGMSPLTPNSNANGWSLLSGMARFIYSYDSRYSLTASIRADGTSRVAFNNRWGYFPSMAAAWRINQEEFMSSVNWIDNLKLRLGYGVTGNQNIPAYQAYDTYEIVQTVINGELVTAGVLGQLPNQNLKWETTASYNLGVDFGFLNNRINGSVDVYVKKTKDLLLNAIIPSTGGTVRGTMYRNMGALENKGIEFALNTVNIQKQNFQWQSTFNIAKNVNKITNLGDNDMIPVGTDVTAQAVLQVGQPIGSSYGWRSNGIWQQDEFTYSFGHADGPKGANGLPLSKGWHLNAVNGAYPASQANDEPGKRKYMDLNGDGVINDDDRTIIGVSQPDFTGSFSNSFNYKQFDLNFMLEFSYGKEIVHGTKWSLIEPNTIFQNKLNYDHWRPTEYEIIYDELGAPICENKDVILKEGNPSNEGVMHGSGNHTANLNDAYIEDGSYLRMKSLTVGYTLPSKLSDMFKIRSARVYLTATNLFTLTGYTGYDPAVNTSNMNGLRPGYDLGAYPLTRSVTAGINVSF